MLRYFRPTVYAQLQVLRGFLHKLYPGTLLPRRPVVVLHPRVEPAGGFAELLGLQLASGGKLLE